MHDFKNKAEIFFGVRIDNLTINEVFKKIKDFLKDGKQHYIVLPYSEFIIRAQKDKKFRKILNEADLSLCESKGLWHAIRFLGKRFKENISGVDFIYRLSNKSQIIGSSLFLLGGEERVVKGARESLIKKYPKSKIVGAENGYQDLEKIIEKVNKAGPDILLVGLGSPKQEKWIYKNLKRMPSLKIAIGVGGAFDFISGRLKRAPKFIQKIGLEWLWRLLLQPWRIKRVCQGVGGLAWLVLKSKICLIK